MAGDHSLQSIMYHAARLGKTRRLAVLLEGFPKEWQQKYFSDESGLSPLVASACSGHLHTVQYLVKIGADPMVKGNVAFNDRAYKSVTALWAACRFGHLDVVIHLTEAGHSDINQLTNEGSPLHAACNGGDFEIVRYLIWKGADIHSVDKFGVTPLILASYRSCPRIVKLLLDSGASVTAISKEGSTALHTACSTDCIETVQMLLDAGCECVSDNSGVTPIMCAAIYGRSSVIEFLMAYVAEQEVRDAIKLCGATILDNGVAMADCISMWRKAMDYGRSLDSRNPHNVYNGLIEFDSLEEIENIVHDLHATYMQALIIRERILGQGHLKTHFFIHLRGRSYYEAGIEDCSFRLWMHGLSLQQKHMRPLSARTAEAVITIADMLIQQATASVLNRNVAARRHEILTRENVLKLFNVVILELQRVSEAESVPLDVFDSSRTGNDILNSLMETGCKMMLLVSREALFSDISVAALDKNISNHQDFALDSVERFAAVTRSLRLYPLHYMVNDQDYYPTALCAVINMWIKIGSEINAKNSKGDTVLHIASRSDPCRTSIIQNLLQNGAEILARNLEDQTCFIIIASKKSLKVLDPVNYVTLQGFAANILQRQKLWPSFRKYVPHLCDFVQIH